jgi:ATP/maltotriose-dependent transcriptional regulator MalT
VAQPADHIAGRVVELGAVDELLGALSLGQSGVLEVAGEPGIGKSRLLAELAARADAQGHLVLSGSASELEDELPFWVFVDALDDHVAAHSPGRLMELDDDARQELAHVLPSLHIPRADSGAGLQQERYRTHRAVRQLLETLARPRPLVLVLDDLHWADSGSIELLGALLRRPPAAAVLIALALRPRQAPERLSGALARAPRTGTLVRLELAPLSEAESRELLGASVSRAVGAALHEESGGNPFYLEQLARSLRRRMDALPSAGDHSLAGLAVPSMVAATLAEELALLSDATRRVLEGAAVAGDPFDLDLAAAAAAVGSTTAMQALDELMRRDLVRPTDVPRRFRFRHPLVRQAVYEATPGGWRLGAHERSAEALAALGAPAAARAHHVEQAGRPGDEAAIELLQAAGEAVANRTPAGAARWFGAALRLLPEAAPPSRRIPLLTALANALAATGQFADARAALEECIQIAPADAVAQRIELAGACAGVEQLLGRHEDAQARLQAALDGLGELVSPEAAGLMIHLAVAGFYRVEYERSREWASRALEVASPLGDRPLVAAATAVLAFASSCTGAGADAERRCSEAAEHVDALSDGELALRLDAAAHLAAAEGYLERFEAAAAHAQRGLAVARATGQGELLPIMSPSFSTALVALGRVPEAIDVLEGAVESARLTANVQALALTLFNRGLVTMLAGDLETALTDAEESVELARDIDASFISTWAAAVVGFVLMERGEHARGIETMVTQGGGADLPLIAGGWRAFCLDRLTRGWLALGRLPEARRAAAAAEAVAAASGLHHPAVMAQRAAASVALDTGELATAAERALASAAAADEIGARLDAGLSRMLAGRAFAQAGQIDEATTHLERAAAELDECGAMRYRDEAERELGKLGRRPRRRTRPGRPGGAGVESLTERELQIARLIVDRRTNSQIAGELFLSPKTVESHIRNLFFKLDVTSRVDVARTIERAERQRSSGP